MTKKRVKGKQSKTFWDRIISRERDAVKAVIFLGVACFFLVMTVYAGGSINSFFAVVIALVCALMGFLSIIESNRKN